MNESESQYQSKILDLATNRYLDQIAPPSKANLNYMESNVDEIVWKVATQIYQQSGFKADLTRVRDIVISRIDNLRVEEKRKAAKEAKRVARLRAEAERKGAEAAQRTAKLLEKLDKNQDKLEIFTKVRKIVSEELEIDELAINVDTNIGQDLNAESWKIFEIITSIEEEFDIEVPDEDAEKLVQIRDLINYLYDLLKLQAERKAEEEERKAAEEAQRKAAEEAQRKAEEEAQRAARWRAEPERKAAEEAQRAAERLEKLNKEEIFIKIRKIVAEELKIDESVINVDTNIGQDLKTKSLEAFDIITSIEEEFDIEISDEEIEEISENTEELEYCWDIYDKLMKLNFVVRKLMNHVYKKIYETTETE